MKKSVIASASIFVLAGSLALAPVVANAAGSSAPSVAASRSFAAVSQRTNNLLTESSSVSVSGDTKWENTESLKVDQVKSPAEIAEEEAQKKAAEEAAVAQSQAQAQAEQQAASRSQQRTEQTTADAATTSAGTSNGDAASSSSAQATTPAPSVDTSNATGDAIVALATQYTGTPYVYGGNTPSGWDCSGFVQWVYSQFGISLPRTSGAQAATGTAVASLAEAKPGDILANGSHAAIYIGNGMVVNALNPAQGTQITGVGVFYGGYSIRRVL